MIEHLIAVLWEDHWKPKLKAVAEFAWYTFVGIAIIGVILFSAIFLEIAVSNLIEIYL